MEYKYYSAKFMYAFYMHHSSTPVIASARQAAAPASVGSSTPAITADSLVPTPHRSAKLHRRFVFTVITRTSPTTLPSTRSARRHLRMARIAPVGLINRSCASLRHAPPRACAYHRSSNGLPLRRPFGPPRRRLCSTLLAANEPFRHVRRRWPLVVASTRALQLRRSLRL